MDRQTPVKILPCPKLRSRAVKMTIQDVYVQIWFKRRSYEDMIHMNKIAI